MKTLSPALVGFLRGLGVIVITSVLSYIGQATNLTFLSPETAVIVAGIALWIEHAMSTPGTAIFGSVRLGQTY